MAKFASEFKTFTYLFHITVAVPTYILGPNTPETSKQYDALDNSGDICPNLTYLGKRGLYTCTSGIRVAYVSGLQAPINSNASARPSPGLPPASSSTSTAVQTHHFNVDDVRATRNSCLASKTSSGEYRGIDILITSQWPQAVDADHEPKPPSTIASPLLAWLAFEIRPRYHLCVSPNGSYVERLPYRNAAGPNSSLEVATRFVALAAVGNAAKDKYIYALSVTPVDRMRVIDLIQKTTNETLCPYDPQRFAQFASAAADGELLGTAQYFYDMKAPQKHQHQGHNNKRRSLQQQQHGDGNNKRPRSDFDQEKCWFCLSSASVERHLVVCIGTYFYVALAKGPLDQTHCLLLPITHVQSSALLEPESWRELTRFKVALARMYRTVGKATFFFERNYRTSHLQVNVVALDQRIEWQVKHAFQDAAERYDLQLETLPPLREPTDLPPHGPYFVAELAKGEVLLTRQMKMFPLHFGREVFCAEGVLACERKVDWKECALQRDEELELVARLRGQFKPFNFVDEETEGEKV